MHYLYDPVKSGTRLPHDLKTREEWLASLNALGEDGWEVVGPITTYHPDAGLVTTVSLLLKRRKA